MTKWAKFCGWMLRKLGWSAGDVAKDKVAVILVAPHTSIWDFAICYLFYQSRGVTTHSLVKKEAFFWPMGPIMRKLGAIPLDRKNPVATIKGTIDKMKNSDERFHLAIAPEGTRKPVKRWKNGYHTIAKALDCPVYLGYVDWGAKRIGYDATLPLTDNPNADTAAMQAYYENLKPVGKHPEKFVTH